MQTPINVLTGLDYWLDNLMFYLLGICRQTPINVLTGLDYWLGNLMFYLLGICRHLLMF